MNPYICNEFEPRMLQFTSQEISSLNSYPETVLKREDKCVFTSLTCGSKSSCLSVVQLLALSGFFIFAVPLVVLLLLPSFAVLPHVFLPLTRFGLQVATVLSSPCFLFSNYTSLCILLFLGCVLLVLYDCLHLISSS